MRALTLALALTIGCASSQTTVAHIADLSLVQTQDARARYYDALNDQCLAQSRSFDAWRVCMTPAYRLDRAVGALDAALRSAQRAYDAGGNYDLDFIIRAAHDLVAIMLDLGIAVPSELRELLQ